MSFIDLRMHFEAPNICDTDFFALRIRFSDSKSHPECQLEAAFTCTFLYPLSQAIGVLNLSIQLSTFSKK